MSAIELASAVANPDVVRRGIVVRLFRGLRNRQETRQRFLIVQHEAFVTGGGLIGCCLEGGRKLDAPGVEIDFTDGAAATALLEGAVRARLDGANGATKVESIGKRVDDGVEFAAGLSGSTERREGRRERERERKKRIRRFGHEMLTEETETERGRETSHLGD